VAAKEKKMSGVREELETIKTALDRLKEERDVATNK
jgi:hypothetical protein